MNSFYSILLYLILLLGITDSIYAQETIRLSGRIKDNVSGEAIGYANIYDSIQQIFATADSNGQFELQLIKGTSYYLTITFIGYKTTTENFIADKNQTLTIRLNPEIQLDGITVLSERQQKTASQNTSGMTTVTSLSVERLPAFVGEKDVLKAVLLTPGVQSGQEGARGLFVRGGSPDQNLMLLHHAPVYNAMHIYGFLSVFTSEAINKLDVHKNYIPVQYGGRLSSVISIEPNYGNTQQWKGGFNIGLITSKFFIEGPLKKDKTSMNFSFRECHAGFFTGPLSKKQFRSELESGQLRYFFYDINAAIKHKVNDKNNLLWSFYAGNDFYMLENSKSYPRKNNFFRDENRRKLSWMNIANTLEWRTALRRVVISNSYAFSYYALKTRQQLNTIYRDYNLLLNEINNTTYKNNSNILEHSWQTHLEHSINQSHRLNYGIKLSNRIFSINQVNLILRDSTHEILKNDTFSNPKVAALDVYTYIDYTFNWKDKIEIKSGAQLFLYHTKGSTFVYPIPRFEFLYHPVSTLTLRTSVIRTVQPLHLLTNNTGEVQNDTWVPATGKIPPEKAWQYSGGIQYDHPNGYTASIDGYYKTMSGLSEYKYGTTFILDKIKWEDQLLNSGIGRAYGVEFFVAKTKGQFTAWAKYNLGWSTRQYPEINEGKPFYYKYDRRHDVSIVLQYKMKKHFDFTLAWTYGTGWRITTPNARFATDNTIYLYDIANAPLTGNQQMDIYWNERNNYTLPAFHHLDFGMNYTKKAERVTHKFNLSIYNLYNRKNIFVVYRNTELDENGNMRRKYMQVSLFPILPSIGYTIYFEK